MSVFAKQDKMADTLLTKHRGKVLAITKATRAGATTSLLKRACELKQKTVIIAPYIQIFERTVEDVEKLIVGKKPKIQRIRANVEICEKTKAKLDEHSELKSLPFLCKPSCRKCELNDPDSCELSRILNGDWDILGLTYAKLRALSLSESETASDLLKKTRQADNLILDEFVTGIITTAPSAEIQVFPSYLSDESERFKRMFEGSVSEAEFYGGIWEFAFGVKIVGDRLTEGGHEIWSNTLDDDCRNFFKENTAKCWQIIEKLAIKGEDTKLAQKIVPIIASEKFFVQKKKGKIQVKPIEDLNEISRGLSLSFTICEELSFRR